MLVVDEATTTSDRDLHRLIWLTTQTGATLRLVGDPAQHGAVEAGGIFRVLCEEHPDDTPELSQTHRLRNPHDRAAADALRTGKVHEALDHLEAAGHLRIVADDLQLYKHILAQWWADHQAGRHHPMIDRRNDTRRQLNRLAHTLLQANGEIGNDEITASDDRRFSVGDRVVARAPNRDLHVAGQRRAYVRNGATGTVTAIHRHDNDPAEDTLTVHFDGIGDITIPRSFFDEHEIAPGRRDVGIDHGYAITSYAAQGSTFPVADGRIDHTSRRSEAYVDITRGQHANRLYLTEGPDPLDGEALPKAPPPPVDLAIADRLGASEGEKTAWEILEATRRRHEATEAIGL